MTRLTPNFTLEELTHSDTALRLGIDNTPPPDIIPNLIVLATGLEAIRAVLGVPVNVTSGYRCEALERVLCEKDFQAWCRRHRRNPVTDWPEYFERKGHPKGYCGDWTADAAEVGRRRSMGGLEWAYRASVEPVAWVRYRSRSRAISAMWWMNSMLDAEMTLMNGNSAASLQGYWQ